MGSELTLTAALDLWHKHGGSTFGPRVEHVSMKESDFLGFCNALLALRSPVEPTPSSHKEEGSEAKRLAAIRPGIYRTRSGGTAEVWGKDGESNPLYPFYGSLPESPDDDAWDVAGKSWANQKFDLIERLDPLPTPPEPSP